MFEKLNSCDLESSKFRGKKSLQIHLRFIYFTSAGHSLFSFGIFVLDVCHFSGSEQSTARTVQPQQKPLLTRRTLLFCSRTVLQHKNVSWRWKLCCVCFSLSSAANLINTAKFAFRLPVCHLFVENWERRLFIWIIISLLIFLEKVKNMTKFFTECFFFTAHRILSAIEEARKEEKSANLMLDCWLFVACLHCFSFRTCCIWTNTVSTFLFACGGMSECALWTSCCSICWSPFPQTPAKIIGCNHGNFCLECIKLWSVQNKTCPICRFPFGKLATRRVSCDGTSKSNDQMSSASAVAFELHSGLQCSRTGENGNVNASGQSREHAIDLCCDGDDDDISVCATRNVNACGHCREQAVDSCSDDADGNDGDGSFGCSDDADDNDGDGSFGF